MKRQYQGHPDQWFGHITYAQHGDDLMILNLFRLMGIEKPSYIDVGAHHPVHISNTKLLYDRGSRGINIEVNPHMIGKFYKERPEDINLNIGIGLQSGTSTFYMYDHHSGLNTMSASQAERTHNNLRVTHKISVPVKTMLETLTEYTGGIWPKLLSLDIEGMDYEILSSLDLISGPYVICVEACRFHYDKMVKMMLKKGYDLIVRLGENLFFTRSDMTRLVQ